MRLAERSSKCDLTLTSEIQRYLVVWLEVAIAEKRTTHDRIKQNKTAIFRQCDVAVTCGGREQLDLYEVRNSWLSLLFHSKVQLKK